MTHDETLAALEEFREDIETLSHRYPDDRDFWPAYANRANALEAGSPSDFRNYVRESILRTIHTVNWERSGTDSLQQDAAP